MKFSDSQRLPGVALKLYASEHHINQVNTPNENEIDLCTEIGVREDYVRSGTSAFGMQP